MKQPILSLILPIFFFTLHLEPVAFIKLCALLSGSASEGKILKTIKENRCVTDEGLTGSFEFQATHGPNQLTKSELLEGIYTVGDFSLITRCRFFGSAVIMTS